MAKPTKIDSAKGGPCVAAMQAKLIRGMVEGKTMTQSALDAGYGRGINASSAVSTASALLSDPKMRARLYAALDRAGATIDASARVVARAHHAKKQTPAGDMIPDHSIRLSAAELNFKSRRLLGPDNDASSQAPVLSIAFVIQSGLQSRGLPQAGLGA